MSQLSSQEATVLTVNVGDIDGSYFASDLPEPSESLKKKWLARWDNRLS